MKWNLIQKTIYNTFNIVIATLVWCFCQFFFILQISHVKTFKMRYTRCQYNNLIWRYSQLHFMCGSNFYESDVNWPLTVLLSILLIRLPFANGYSYVRWCMQSCFRGLNYNRKKKIIAFWSKTNWDQTLKLCLHLCTGSASVSEYLLFA